MVMMSWTTLIKRSKNSLVEQLKVARKHLKKLKRRRSHLKLPWEKRR